MSTLKTHTQVREYESGIGNDVVCVFDGRFKKSSGSKCTTFGSISPAGLDTQAVAYLARNEIASRLRSRQPLQLCLLVGGMVRCNNNPVISPSDLRDGVSSFSERVKNQILAGSAVYTAENGCKPNEGNGATGIGPNPSDSQPTNFGNEIDATKLINPFLAPKLFWLDQYGSLQNLRYGAHGYGSNFALSVLDQRYRPDMTRQEAVDLIRECFEQLRQRYVMNSPKPPRIKCVDADGVTEIACALRNN